MYKVLIADEDSKYVTLINRAAERSTEKIKVVGIALTGGEAVQKTKEMQPDILFIDVKLSGLNGIESVKRIRGFDKNVHIIILTEYDDFQFIKEFIDLRIDSYLLKPIKNELLFISIEKVIKKINEEAVEKEIVKQNEKDMKERLRYTEYSFIYSLLFSGEYKNEIESYQNQLMLEPEGYIINIEVEPYINRTKDNDKSSNILYQCIRNTITQYNACAVGAKMMDRIIAYVCEKKSYYGEEQRQNIIHLCSMIAHNIKAQLNINVRIGVGNINRLEELHASYEEALRCLRYRGNDDTEIVHVFDLDEKMVIVHKSYIEIERLMLESVKKGQSESIDYFSSLLDMLKTLKTKDRINKIIELLILTCHCARLEGPNEGDFLNYVGYIEELERVGASELDAWAYQKFQYLIKIIRIRKTSRIPYVIHNAINYIDNRYTEGISLDDVANHVGLTPQYFSAYFKESMDCNLVDYITNLRIEKAKEIIRNSQMSVQEICFFVGYHDPNYFSRIFKKYVGCTPSQYKKDIENILY